MPVRPTYQLPDPNQVLRNAYNAANDAYSQNIETFRSELETCQETQKHWGSASFSISSKITYSKYRGSSN